MTPSKESTTRESTPPRRAPHMQRTTRQSQVILAILDEAIGPITPEAILREGKKRVKSLGLATVYRVLRALVNEGRAVAIEIPGSKPHYERAPMKPHHHFVCSQCGRVYKLEGEVPGVDSIKPEGFEMICYEVFVTGCCRTCGEAAARLVSKTKRIV